MIHTQPTPEGVSGGQLFYTNRQLLDPDQRAPVPLAANPRRVFQAVLRQLFVTHDVNRVLIEPAAITAGSAIVGCQEFVLGCHGFIEAAQPQELRTCCRRLVSACRELNGTTGSLYAVEQAAAEIASRAAAGAEARPTDDEVAADEAVSPPCSRLKHLDAKLEEHFDRIDFAVPMALEVLGLLQVHLDATYDLACRILEGFYFALLRSPAPGPVCHCCRQLYREVTRSIVPEHIVVQARSDGPRDSLSPEERRGLLDLLQELDEAVARGIS